MAGSNDDRFEDDSELEQFEEEFDEREGVLHDLISEFMDQEEIDEAYTAQMLINLALKMRMMAYVIEVDQPSVAGLKLDLDRLHQELGQSIREAKKAAAEYIELAKATLEEAAREDDASEDDASEDDDEAEGGKSGSK